ncbi:MAG: M24 family metallopeptidase [Thermoplasmatota archaeon]
MSKYSLDHRKRIDRLRNSMDNQDIDAALLFERGNVRYFTGWHQNPSSFSLLYVSQDDMKYLVPELDFKAVQTECWIDSDNIYKFEADPVGRLDETTETNSIDSVGIEKDSILSVRKEKIKSALSKNVKNVNELINELRIIKSKEEINLYREAAEKTSEVMNTIIDELEVGMKEREISARAKYLMESLGAEGQSFEPFAMSGNHSWMPHRSSTDKELKKGDLTLLDMGMMWDGYSTDMTRTFMVGKPSEEQEDMFEAAAEAQKAAIEALGPGVIAEEVHKAAVNVFKEYGYEEYFPHLTGHGVGCDIHENPIIDEGHQTELKPGMIATIEPGIYKEGVGGARIEDMVLITDSGYEVLTEAPRNLQGLSI